MNTSPRPITSAGVVVATPEGTLGITTSQPYRNGSIGVQLVGMPYPVKCSADELTRVSVEVTR